MEFNIIKMVNALLASSVLKENSSYLHLGNNNCKFFRSIDIDKKVLVYNKALEEEGIVMTNNEYLDKYTMTFDVIYYTSNPNFEIAVEEITKVIERLNNDGVLLMNYYYSTTEKICLYLRSFQKHLRVDSIAFNGGAMLLVRQNGTGDNFFMDLEKILSYTNSTLAKRKSFDVNDLDDKTKELFDFKKNDFCYEVLCERYPTLSEHLSSLFA